MLTIDRDETEQIVIETRDGPVVISVVKVEGCRVRIGVEAPKCIRIDRAEVHERRRASWFANAEN